MSASDAVNKPKFHHQWLPDEVFIEKEFDITYLDRAIKRARQDGHTAVASQWRRFKQKISITYI